jgi:hypothetical protein
LLPLIPIRGVCRRAWVITLPARRTRTTALLVITGDVGANRSTGAQLRSLVGARSTAHFRADRRQARTRRDALVTERLCSALDIVHSHCMPVHGIRGICSPPLTLSLPGVAIEHAAIVATGKSHRCAQRRRRNQTGSSGENQASGKSKSAEQHVNTAFVRLCLSVLAESEYRQASPTG